MVSESSRGHYDFDKPENITDLYSQSNRTNWKNRSYRMPLEPGLKLKIQLLAEFCHPSCDMKFADPREKFESLRFKPTTQRNLKHKVPNVTALVLCSSVSTCNPEWETVQVWSWICFTDTQKHIEKYNIKLRYDLWTFIFCL